MSFLHATIFFSLANPYFLALLDCSGSSCISDPTDQESDICPRSHKASFKCDLENGICQTRVHISLNKFIVEGVSEKILMMQEKYHILA